MPPRPSSLVFTSVRYAHDRPRPEDVRIVMSCPDGIPVGWFFCFGGRNFQEPDETVEQKGGTAAERNRFETPLDVAEARLGQAVQGFRDAPHMCVWFGALEVLRRRVLACGKTGFLRLEASWAFADGKQREHLYSMTALAENAVNQAASGNFGQLSNGLKALEEFAPFVPLCSPEDRKRFDRAPKVEDFSGANRAAALLVGLPPQEGGSRERFVTLVEKTYAQDFATLESLPPYPSQAKAGGAAGAPSSAAKDAEASGVLGRFKSLFRKT